MESAFVLQSMEAPLLLERGLQVAQHTELGEHDGSGVVAVERAHLPILNMEDTCQRKEVRSPAISRVSMMAVDRPGVTESASGAARRGTRA